MCRLRSRVVTTSENFASSADCTGLFTFDESRPSVALLAIVARRDAGVMSRRDRIRRHEE
jgi:hypothetical protein